MSDPRTGFERVTLAHGESSLRCLTTGETFHPVLGPTAEAEQLYIGPSGLVPRWKQGLDLCVWDVGFGAAGNAAAVWKAWKKTAAGSCRMTSFDLDRRALNAAREYHQQDKRAFDYLSDVPADAWRAMEQGEAWQKREEGRTFHWHWVWGDFIDLAGEFSASVHDVPDVVIYDPYSPARNPEMWSLGHWQRLAAFLRSGPGTTLHYYSRSTALRVTLLLAGFFVGRGAAAAEKEETTVAATRIELLDEPLGRKFLERVARSTNAAPFIGGARTVRTLAAAEWERLESHPQWGG